MEELIEVLDENGIKTGEILTRSEVHKRGLWHAIVVVVCVDRSGKILMQQRSNDVETYKGYWDVSAAGHISAGQDSLSAGVRELDEEVGIKTEQEKLRFLTRYKRSYETSKDEAIENLFADCYLNLCDTIDIDSIKKQEGEVDQVKLCTLSEIFELIKANKILPREKLYEELAKCLDKLDKEETEFDI